MNKLFDLGLMEQAEEQDSSVEDTADEFTEAERRLSLARYYQQLTRGGLFGEDSDEARVVDEEVREFARKRMNVLIGIQAEAEPSVAQALPFTDEQVAALSQWADHMIERAAQPTIRQVSPPAAAPIKPQAAGPRLKPVAAAPPQAKRKPTAMAKKPLAKPAKPVAAKPEPKADEAPAIDYASIPDGEVFEENGKKYKFIQTDRPGDDGQPKRVKLDVTEQARSPLSIPMPRRDHMPYVTDRQANENVDASFGGSQIAMAAAALSINRNE